MNKKLLAIAVAGALAAPMGAHAAAHEGGPSLMTYGQVGVKLVMPDYNAAAGGDTDGDGVLNNDWYLKATKARLGFRASQETSVGKWIGEIEFDLDDIANESDMGESIVDTATDTSENNVDMRRARVILATKSAGTFVFAARSPSGQYSDLYGNLDIFNVGHNMGVFAQGEFTRNVAAWKTPTTADIYAVFALLSLTDSDGGPTDDGDDIDVKAVRVIWNSGPWHAGVGMVDFSANAATDRTAINVGYGANGMAFAFTYEDLDNAANGEAWGAVGSFSSGNNTFKVGLSKYEETGYDADITELEWAHSFSKNVQGFINHGIAEDNDGADASETAIGVNINF